MKFIGQAKQAAADILKAFENPQGLPKPLANIFIRRRDNVPCRKWSWRNQLLVALRGCEDARGFRQWQAVGRNVKAGERAFHILAPTTRNVIDGVTDKERFIVIGFKSIPVFGFEQTEGAPLAAKDPEADKWIESLPLLQVAKSWGLAVETFDGESADCLAWYRRRKGIGVGTTNLSTWTHELVHAADDRNGKLKEDRQHWRSETVAELGSAILLRLLGFEDESDLGGCWGYINRYSAEAGIEVVDACGRVLDRTCSAVALILDTAQKRPEVQMTFA